MPRFSSPAPTAQVFTQTHHRIFACLLLLSLILPQAALAASNLPPIIIGGTSGNGSGQVNHEVRGNGNPYNDGDPANMPATATVEGGSVTVNSGGTVNDSAYGGYAQGTSIAAEAQNNSVTLNGGTVTGSAYGGHAQGAAAAAEAQNNSVTLNGGTVGNDAYGGSAYSDTGAATANGNSVVIRHGEQRCFRRVCQRQRQR